MAAATTVALSVAAAAAVAGTATAVQARKDAKGEASRQAAEQAKLDKENQALADEQAKIQEQEGKVTAANKIRASNKKKRILGKSSTNLLSGGDLGIMANQNKSKLGS